MIRLAHVENKRRTKHYFLTFDVYLKITRKYLLLLALTTFFQIKMFVHTQNEYNHQPLEGQ